jgi:hypothetical protein
VGTSRAVAGQAMTEYAIVLALVAGANWLGNLGQTITENPLTTALVATAVLVVGYALGMGRR